MRFFHRVPERPMERVNVGFPYGTRPLDVRPQSSTCECGGTRQPRLPWASGEKTSRESLWELRSLLYWFDLRSFKAACQECPAISASQLLAGGHRWSRIRVSKNYNFNQLAFSRQDRHARALTVRSVRPTV